MKQDKVDILMMQYKDKIPADEALYVRGQLLAAGEEAYGAVSCAETKSPVATVLLSIFFGGLGIDRFYIGDIGLGLLKLFFGPIVAILCAIATGVLTGMSESMALEQILQISAIISLVSIAAAVITGLWWLIDCFCSYKKAKKKNLQNILDAVQPYMYAQQPKKNGWY